MLPRCTGLKPTLLHSSLLHSACSLSSARIVYHRVQSQDSSSEPKKKKARRKSAVSGRVGKSEMLSSLPASGSVKIFSAEFVKSSVTVEACPKEVYPEFAVIGRSNVGKSSLINLLTQRKNLALISKTPGKTKCINHFLINNKWYLVDLPGYGYTERSQQTRMEWNQFTRDYFTKRGTLANVLLLIDASIPPLPLDIYCANWLGDAEVPFTVVFTKVDKRKSGGPGPIQNIKKFQEQLLDTWESLPPCFATSARLGDGRDELYVSQLVKLFKASDHLKKGLGGRYTHLDLESIREKNT